MEENISTNTCADDVFDTTPYIAVSVVSAITGLISVVACLLVIGLILLFKKHYFFSQRLILYLCIAAFLNSLSISLRFQRLAHATDNNATKWICILTAAFDQTTAWTELLAIACIVFDLALKVILRVNTEKLEKFYIFLTFVFPLLINWIPFIKESYGPAGAWCWIRSKTLLNDSSCPGFSFGSYLRFILWYVPLYVIIIIMIATYVLVIYKVRRQRHHWTGKYDPESEKLKEKMQQEVRPLLWYPLIYFVLNIFPLVNRIHDAVIEDPELTLWILHAVFSPLQGGIIAMAYTLDKETLRRLNCTRIKAALLRLREDTVTEYPAKEEVDFTDSFDEKEKERTGTYKSSYKSFPEASQDVESPKHTYNGTGSTTAHMHGGTDLGRAQTESTPL